MTRSWLEDSSSGPEVRKHSHRGWLWTLTVLLVGTVIALIITFRINSYAVNKSRQAEQLARAAGFSAEQANGLAQQATARADSAKQLASVIQQRLVAINAKMMELASAQYAIEVRADRLDSAVTSITAGLEELDQSVQKDFNFVADRIDTALAVADAATVKANEAQQSVTQLRSGFDAMRKDFDRRQDRMAFSQRLHILAVDIPLHALNIWRDNNFKRK